MSKTVLIAVALLLVSGCFAVSNTAAAHDASYSYERHSYSAGLYATGAYGEVSRENTDYYLTSSPFCPPDRSNAYDGGFATLAYGADGRLAGYVCR
jgi:hypothetical protein